VVTFDKDQLKKAVEHLAFEVQHFRCYARLHRENRLGASTPTVAQAVRYSLLLHFRLLLDFFYGRAQSDDCSVDHFKALPGFAAAFGSKPEPKDVATVREDLNKRLAHLTATRWEKKAPPMDYYEKHFDRIENLMVRFQAALPDDVRQVFINEVGEWERKHPGTI